MIQNEFSFAPGCFPLPEVAPVGGKSLSSVCEYRVQQVSRAFVREDIEKTERADKAVEFFNQFVTQASWFDPMKECVIVIALDRKNRPLGWNLVSLGTVSSSLVSPREVFRPLIVAAASAFIMMHNHPSGDTEPSAADIRVTREIREAARVVAIDFADHVIVGNKAHDPSKRGYYSFREAGLI